MALPPPFSLPNLLLFWWRDAAEQIKAGDRVGWFPPHAISSHLSCLAVMSGDILGGVQAFLGDNKG